MVCEEVANMTQMRHDNLAHALRRGDIVPVLPRLKLAAVDVRIHVVVAHASANSYAAQAAKEAAWAAAKAVQTRRTRFRNIPD